MNTSRDVRSLAAAINRARPRLRETDQRLSLALYRLLSEGKPVTPAELVVATDLPASEIGARLDEWPGAFRDEQGRVVGLWGLSVLEMPPHEVLLQGRKLWAWCAWDTLFLPRRLGATLDVRSRCPITGERSRCGSRPKA